MLMRSKFVKRSVVILAIAVVAYLLYAFVSGLFPFGGMGSGDGTGDASAIIVVDEPEVIEELDAADETVAVEEVEIAEETPSLVIEISEDRLIFNDEVVTFDELEEILRRYAGTEDIWELHDVFRADRATYERVRELLRMHDVVYRQR